MKKTKTRKPFNRLKISSAKRTLWIFGAGASHSSPYNTPLQKDLLDHFVTKKGPGPKSAEIFKIINDVLPGASASNVLLEELFSAYELRASHPRSSMEEVGKAKGAIHTLHGALAKAVMAYGPGSLPKWKPYQRNKQDAPYAELMEKLYPIDADAADIRKHGLVTMNYDIHLDRCVINMRLPAAGEMDVDYGIDFTDYRIPGSFERPRPRAILLLRPHGSLNWLRCLACRAIFTTVSKHADVSKRSLCSSCKTQKLDRILVHPSYLRNYSDPSLQIIWGRMQEELIASDRWVFVGYSLPDADVHLRDVLRHAFMARRRKPKVVWAGYRSPQDDGTWETERARYYAMFGDALRPWNATSGGFAEFVKKLY
jgi:hypothetical protein